MSIKPGFIACLIAALLVGTAIGKTTRNDDGRQRHYTEQDGFTPWSIDQAMYDGNIVYLRKAIEAGWDINEPFVGVYRPDERSPRFDGRLALELIVGNFKARSIRPVVEFLIASGADVNGRDRYGNLPLHSAVGLQDVGIVELLLQNGADPNSYARTREERHTAIMAFGTSPHEGSDLRIVEALLAAGADVSLRDGKGRPAYAEAARLGNFQAVERIKQEMRRLGLKVE